MDAYGEHCDPQSYKKAYKSLKNIANVLGTVRDTDVLIQQMQERLQNKNSEEQAGVQWLIERLRIYHKDQQQKMEGTVQKLSNKPLQQNIEVSIQEGEDVNG
jgi:CHAD domain-containing protein